MFFIVNKTKKTVVLGDISVSLGPKQAIDLDRIMKRSKSDESKHLKIAKKQGNIEIRVKDGEKPRHQLAQPISTVPNLNDVKNEIIGEMKVMSRELLSQQNQPVSGLSQEDLEAFAQKIIASIPQSSKTVIIKEGTNSTDEEVEMDETLLAEIGERAVEKSIEGTELKAIKYKEEEAKDTILDNIDELGKLLG